MHAAQMGLQAAEQNTHTHLRSRARSSATPMVSSSLLRTCKAGRRAPAPRSTLRGRAATRLVQQLAACILTR
jgi:hypothetical protein